MLQIITKITALRDFITNSGGSGDEEDGAVSGTKSWFDRLVDAINRLIRPGLFALCAFFLIWPIFNSADALTWANVVGKYPEYFWFLLISVFMSLASSKLIRDVRTKPGSGYGMGYTKPTKTSSHDEDSWGTVDQYDPDLIIKSDTDSNSALQAWKKKKNASK